MNPIGNIQNPNIQTKPIDQKTNSKTPTTSIVSESLESEKSVVYSSSQATEKAAYKPDMEKVLAMKEETDQRLIELFTGTVKDGSLKQIGGLRGYLQRLIDGTSTEEDIALNLGIEVSDESIAKAKADVAQDGYWGAEATSDRFLDFAKALSGSDPAKADMLLDAVKAGYKEAEAIWGDTLPELSQKTLELTIQKFNDWRDGSN